MNSYSGRRIAGIDVLRVLAICMVVLCHSVEEGIFDLTLCNAGYSSRAEEVFAITGFTIGRIGVPIFLMLSGFLLLDRRYDSEQVEVFWKKKWMGLIICTQIWFVVYDLFLHVLEDRRLFSGDILYDALFIHKVPMSHTWYMPMIIGIYFLIPFVANALHEMNDFQLKIIFLFFLALL